MKEEDAAMTMRRAALALGMFLVMFIVMALAVFAQSADPKDPKSLEGGTWAVKDWATSGWRGKIVMDMNMTVEKVRPDEKDGQLVVEGTWVTWEKTSDTKDSVKFVAKAKEKKGFPKFTFSDSRGEWLTIYVQPSGDLVLSGRLPDVTLKRVVENQQ
jgi:hypothetical protein